ncbi:hypothetical protein FQZ97_960050 [compost metagenome]
MQFYRIVLLGHLAEVQHLVGAEVDAAHEGHGVVHHHQLAVHAPQQVQLLAEQRAAGIEDANLHAGAGEPAEEVLGEPRRAEAVDGEHGAHAAPGTGAQRVAQRAADLVFFEDEGFQQGHVPGLAQGLEDAWKECVAVLQQARRVAVGPVRALHVVRPGLSAGA